MNIFSNIGVTELIVILALALLVVGPERLPELARQVGKLLRDLRKAYENLTRELGPELTSIQKTTLELRESVEAVRSIPQDLVKSVVQAADMGSTLKGFQDVADSVKQAGQSLSGVGSALKQPVQSALTAASNEPIAQESLAPQGDLQDPDRGAEEAPDSGQEGASDE